MFWWVMTCDIFLYFKITKLDSRKQLLNVLSHGSPCTIFFQPFAMQRIVIFVFAQPPFPYTIIISCSSENNFGDSVLCPSGEIVNAFMAAYLWNLVSRKKR